MKKAMLVFAGLLVAATQSGCIMDQVLAYGQIFDALGAFLSAVDIVKGATGV